MSVGYAPTQPPPFDPSGLSDEDKQRLAAQMAQPAPSALPSPAPAAVPLPEPPPPMETPASPAPFAPPDSGAIASKMAAVGQPPVPPTPTTPPASPPATAAAPATTPETPKQTDELRAADDEAKKARTANEQAQTDFQKAAEPAVHERARLAAEQVTAQQDAIKQQQLVQQRYQAAEDAATAQIAQSQDAIKKFKFRDYFSDGEGGTNWARKIGAALMAGLGAFGAGLTHGPNYALQILNKDMDDAHQHQVDDLNKMRDEEVMQRTGLNDIRAARQKALADLTVNDAARDKLVASQLDQVTARQGEAQFAPSLAKFSAQLKQDAADKDAAAKKQLVDLNLKLQDEQRKAHLDTASIDEKEALTKLHGVQAAAGGFARVARGTHEGGGGAGNGAPDPEGLADVIRKGKNGQPLTDVEIIHEAAAHHIPLAGKAGVTTLQTVRNVAKFDADAASKAAKTGIQGERLDETKFKDFEKEHGLPKLEFTQHKLDEVLNKLDKGNPVGAMSSLMEFDAAAKGANATEASMHAIQGRLGGAWEQFKGLLQKGENGTFSDEQRNLLKGAVKDALGGNRETVDKVHDAFGRQFDYSKPGVKQRAAGMFGALGYRSAEGGGAVDEAKVARAQAARAGGTPQQKANAESYLRSVGRL